MHGLEQQLGGPWSISEKSRKGIAIAYSDKHATDGDYSLEISSQGGWSQVLMYTENSTTEIRNPVMHELLAGKLTLDLDVYTEESLDWSKVEVAMQGTGLPWTQLSTNTLTPGSTSVKYLIPPKVSAALKNCSEWFQLIIMVNMSGPGTVYIDRLSVE